MVEIKRLSERLSVCAQPAPDEFSHIARAGFRTVVNNRLDGEADEQPPREACRQEAKAAGLDYRHVPVRPNAITDEDIDAFAEILRTAPGPVLAHCRTGGRSAALWALADDSVPAEEAIAAAKAAGFDLSLLAPRMAARRRQDR